MQIRTIILIEGSLVIFIILLILLLYGKENETLTGEGTFVLKNSGCDEYYNISSDTQGFHTASILLYIFIFVIVMMYDQYEWYEATGGCF